MKKEGTAELASVLESWLGLNAEERPKGLKLRNSL